MDDNKPVFSLHYNSLEDGPISLKGHGLNNLYYPTANDEYLLKFIPKTVVGEPLSNIKLRPNPFSEMITVELRADSEKIINYDIIDVDGNTIYSNIVKVVRGQNQFEIQGQELHQSGVYYLLLSEKNEHVWKRLVYMP